MTLSLFAPAAVPLSPMARMAISYQDLILSNCRSVVRDAQFDIVSQLDSSDTWTCHVLKTERGERTAFLSGRSGSLEDTLEELFKKSALAVDQYVRTNGFGLPPQLSTRTSRGRREKRRSTNEALTAPSPLDLEQSEIISLDGDLTTSSTDSEASHAEDSWDDDDDGAIHVTRSDRRHRRSFRGLQHMVVKNADHRESHLTHRHENRSLRVPPPPPAAYRLPPVPARVSLTPMGVGGIGVPPPPPPPPAAGSGVGAPCRIISAPPVALPQVKFQAKPLQPTYSVLLRVHWIGLGDLNVLDQCTLLVSSIKSRALHIARTRRRDFKSTPGLLPASFDSSSPLYAKIRRLRIGDHTYEMADFGDDLSALVDKDEDPITFMRVDVELNGWLGTFTLPPPPPPPAPSQGICQAITPKDEIIYA